ncbi:nitronate monooxygenase [Bacillus methanolicus]|uniref:nitronate monooxygenase n=1 Tax=Bacillus methanolicus TaxID=1471 RepID=UPI00315942B1
MKNIFIEEMAPYEEQIPPFPIQNTLTGTIRKKSAALNNKKYMSLWAGQGVRLAKQTTVAKLMAKLVQDIDALTR